MSLSRKTQKRLDWLKARRRTLVRVAFEMSKDDVVAELEGIQSEIRSLLEGDYAGLQSVRSTAEGVRDTYCGSER